MSLNDRFRPSQREGRDPADFLHVAETAPACVIGDPPRALRQLHQPRFVNRWLQRIRDRIAEPVEIEWVAGERNVQVLGQIVLRFTPEGTITPHLWVLGDDLKCQQVDPFQINLDGLPHGWVWLERFREAFQRELMQRLGAPDHRIPAYATWVFRQVRARLRHDGNLPTMRRRIAAALALDAGAMAIARRIGLESDPRISVRISAYNEALAHRADYDKLSRECPGLVPLFAMLRPVLPPHGEPAARLRHRLLDIGVSPATWRVIHHGNGRLLRLVCEFYRHRCAGSAEDLLRIVDLLAPSTQPPVWFVRTLLYFFGNFGQRRDEYLSRLRKLAPPLRRLMSLTERAGSAETAEIRDNLYRVVTWLGGDASARSHPHARKASWRWFRRHADAWHEAQEQKALSDRAIWDTPFVRLELDGFSVVALRTRFELWQEGRVMRHCAAMLDRNCRRRTTLVFSLRRPGRARPVATMRADRDKTWHLDQVAACANTVPPPAAERVARRVVDLINAQGWMPTGLREAERSSQQPLFGSNDGAADRPRDAPHR